MKKSAALRLGYACSSAVPSPMAEELVCDRCGETFYGSRWYTYRTVHDSAYDLLSNGQGRTVSTTHRDRFCERCTSTITIRRSLAVLVAMGIVYLILYGLYINGVGTVDSDDVGTRDVGGEVVSSQLDLIEDLRGGTAS